MRVASDRALLRFVNGLSRLLDGRQPLVGKTPKDVVFKEGKLEVWRYRTPKEPAIALGTEEWVVSNKPVRVPLLIIPPLMVRPYVYDLRPGHSLVEFFAASGFDTFLVDFGEPDQSDAHVRLDDYVLSFVPAALKAVRAASGSRAVSILGYCLGGIFGLLYSAAWHDPDIAAIVTVGAPIDFRKMGILSVFAKTAQGQVSRLSRRIGNIPGGLSATGLKLITPLKMVTRYADLFVNLWDDEFVKGYDSINHWMNDFIDYPAAAFQQFFGELMVGNKLVSGDLKFGDRVANLKDVRCPVLSFAGEDDKVAAPASAKEIQAAVGSSDLEYHLVPGGHIGVIAGGSAPERVWKPSATWLRAKTEGG